VEGCLQHEAADTDIRISNVRVFMEAINDTNVEEDEDKLPVDSALYRDAPDVLGEA
jgi:hypothetical protein